MSNGYNFQAEARKAAEKFKLIKRLGLRITEDRVNEGVGWVRATDLEARLQKGVPMHGHQNDFLHLELKPLDQRVSKSELIQHLESIIEAAEGLAEALKLANRLECKQCLRGEKQIIHGPICLSQQDSLSAWTEALKKAGAE